jgi:vancomycin resistance protein VanW
MSARRVARRVVPVAVRWRLRALTVAANDRLHGTRFASQFGNPAGYPYLLCRYHRPLLCYPGQEHRFEAKRGNVERSLASVDRRVMRPGEVFSFWQAVGRPTRTRGYQPAAAIKDGVLTEDVGGAICLSSTLLYNIGLLCGLSIIERHCHSVDSYGDARYFELGRDAAVEHPYRDLRFRNDLGADVMLRARVEADAVVGEAWSSFPLDVKVDIDIQRTALDEASAMLRVSTRRVVVVAAKPFVDEQTESVYATAHRR